MPATFDPSKDAENVRKHGISLARAVDMLMLAVVPDTRRNYGETRYRAFGYIDGDSYCLAFTTRDGDTRAISLRRARAKE